MITLITGVPGAGKTLYMMSLLLNSKELKGRPLYIDGISGIDESRIDYQQVPDGESMQTWYKWAPVGAVLVIDEAQRVFRTRPSGSKVPEFVAELETHRHSGIDFFILTQHPRLIDANLRALVGNHKHISKTQLGVRRIIEWQRTANPEAKSDIKDGLVSIYTLDKAAMGVYKSSEEHTKISVGRSRWFYVFPFALFILIISLFYAVSYIRGYIQPKPKENVEQKHENKQPDLVTQLSGSAAKQVAPQSIANESKGYDLDYFKPVAEGEPWTAKAYDQQRVIQTMPYPVGCVENGNRCTCYTEQATPIKMSRDICLDFVKNGIYNPYKRYNESESIGGKNAVVQGSEKA
ncbi:MULTISPECIES: zonular occludens toxin family protein [Snodgrassella]|uniref:zonular occludens toxin family protein n=1 Tax=Snodgrassella TaxID=1193515 RepID=UPI000C1EF69E|nr:MULTISPECIES: zonular occludens toxin domain-containing protein [Snodgrassella]MCO6526274.1 AAA family ATPase [Snodgrassella sp.]PIT21377.1 hypothetical protein BGI35_05820 [Snodgrassella communis]